MQVLERLDPSHKYFEGKRAACLGFVQQLAAGESAAAPSKLSEVLAVLKDSPGVEVADMITTLLAWASASGFPH
jgi:intraflagellar transport protein 56